METTQSIQYNADQHRNIICQTLTIGEMHYSIGYNADTGEFAFSERPLMESQNIEMPIVI